MTDTAVAPSSSSTSWVARSNATTHRLRDASVPWAGVAARIIAGMLWLFNTDWKRPPDFGRPNRGLWVFTNHGIENEVFGPFRWVLQEIVVPNFKLFGWITLGIEVLLAAMLLGGVFTRLAALLGLGQAIAITLSVLNTPGEYNWAYYMMIALHLAIFAYGAGPWSVDSLIAKGRARDTAAVRRAVDSGRVALVVFLGAVGALLVYKQRDNDFSLNAEGATYFREVATGNQALRGTVLLGITLIVIGIVVAAVARMPRPSRIAAIVLSVSAVFCAATYGRSINIFGGAPSTCAIILIPAAFLFAAAWAQERVDGLRRSGPASS